MSYVQIVFVHTEKFENVDWENVGVFPPYFTCYKNELHCILNASHLLTQTLDMVEYTCTFKHLVFSPSSLGFYLIVSQLRYEEIFVKVFAAKDI